MPSSRTESVNCRSILADRKVVPDEQIELFCKILHFRHECGEHYDTEEGRTIYYNRLRPLLPKLKFPLSNPGLVEKLILPKQSEYTYLCTLHKGLNADFVHQWFKFLALEVGARLEILRSGQPEYIGHYAWDHVIKPLTRLHKIWEAQSRVTEAFGCFTETGYDRIKDLIPVDRQSDGCEACILARIGSHAPTLFALRIAVKSRISLHSSVRHPHRLRLLRLIEPWIENWRSRFDYKSERETARNQQIRDNVLLADQLYCKRKHLEVIYHEFKYAHIHEVQKSHPDNNHDDPTGILYQAENDIIDSYAALRATQRESQMIRASISRSPVTESTTMLSGEDPYKPKTNQAYRESRYSTDTNSNNERVICGNHATASDTVEKRRGQSTDSSQTTWGDVIGLGASSASNPYAKATPSPLARIPERYSGQQNLQSERGSIRNSIRGAIPPMKSELQRQVSIKSSKGNDVPQFCNSMDMFNPSEYNAHRYSAAESLVSPLQKMDFQDGYNKRDSPVSSMSGRQDHRPQKGRSRNSYRQSMRQQEHRNGDHTASSIGRREAMNSEEAYRYYRDSRDSSWTDASIPASPSRLSRPFQQPDYEGSDRERLSRRERRG